MPNTKVGTTWAPDIRPESIETFDETYTPEGGEQQTVTYKRVADHPILNGIRDIKAFFTTHAAAVWYNKLAKRTIADEIDDLKIETLEITGAVTATYNIYCVTLTINTGYKQFSSGWNTIAGIPERMRPRKLVPFVAIDNYSGTRALLMRMNTDGILSLWLPESFTAVDCQGTVTYLL